MSFQLDGFDNNAFQTKIFRRSALRPNNGKSMARRALTITRPNNGKAREFSFSSMVRPNAGKKRVF